MTGREQRLLFARMYTLTQFCPPLHVPCWRVNEKVYSMPTAPPAAVWLRRRDCSTWFCPVSGSSLPHRSRTGRDPPAPGSTPAATPAPLCDRWCKWTAGLTGFDRWFRPL